MPKWLVFKEDAEDASQEVFLRVTRAAKLSK